MVSQEIIVSTAEKNKSVQLIEFVAAIVINTKHDFDKTGGLISAIKERLQKFDNLFDKHIKRALEQHRGLLADKRTYTEPLKAALSLATRKSADWLEEQKRLAREADLRRLNAEMEAKRLAVDATEKAFAFDANGESDKADKLIEEAHSKAQEIIAGIPETPRPVNKGGITSRFVPKFEVVDESKIPRPFLSFDEGKARAYMRDTDGKGQIPGVRIWMERTDYKRG